MFLGPQKSQAIVMKMLDMIKRMIVVILKK